MEYTGWVGGNNGVKIGIVFFVEGVSEVCGEKCHEQLSYVSMCGLSG